MKTIIDGQIGFLKENSCYFIKHQKKKDLFLLATKLIEKNPDATNAKQHHQFYLKNMQRSSKNFL